MSQAVVQKNQAASQVQTFLHFQNNIGLIQRPVKSMEVLPETYVRFVCDTERLNNILPVGKRQQIAMYAEQKKKHEVELFTPLKYDVIRNGALHSV